MIVVVPDSPSSQRVAQAIDYLRKRQIETKSVAWGIQTMLVTKQNLTSTDMNELKAKGIAERIVVSSSRAPLTSRDLQNDTSIIEVGNARFGAEKIVIVAGPCSVESREQLMETARAVKKLGVSVLRGGVFKPRTSPYEFQGLGEAGLKLLAEAREETGLPVVTEVLEPEKVDLSPSILTCSRSVRETCRTLHYLGLLENRERQLS